MRTKILLTAAAAMVAGLVSSNAQVYSANVVGYVNVVSTAGQYTACANPLDLDGVDVVTNILANAPGGTVVQIWNGAGYTLVSRSSFGAHAWSANAGTNNIPPGVGFFIQTPTTYTNTYVGTVIPNENATNNFPVTGGLYNLVGSILPVSGTITNAADQGVDALNLASMPKGTVLQIWNGSGYTLVSRGSFGTGVWSANPTISVGQSFFINAGATTNWVQVLQ